MHLPYIVSIDFWQYNVEVDVKYYDIINQMNLYKRDHKYSMSVATIFVPVLFSLLNTINFCCSD